MKEKKPFLLRIKIKFLLCLLLMFFAIFCIWFNLMTYLYDVQKLERLDKVEDYSKYVLSYQKQSRCRLIKKFEIENISFYYDCLDDVYISYGSTKVTLEEIMKLGYFDLDMLIQDMKKQNTEEENQKLYLRMSTDKTKGYQILVETTEDHTNVTIRSWDE